MILHRIAPALVLSLTLSLSGGTAMAADLIHKISPHSVSVTIDRLAAAVEGAGAKVFARVDHAAGRVEGSRLRTAATASAHGPGLATAAPPANAAAILAEANPSP